MNVPELLERLDDLAARANEPPILAFDADGTLWSGDVTRDLVAFIMSARPLVRQTPRRLDDIAVAHGGEARADIYDQLAWLMLSFSIGRVPDAAAVESVVVSFAGLEELHFEDLVARAIVDARLERRFRPGLRTVFDWAATRGVSVVVVSASPRLAVEHALARVGLSASAVLGVSPRVADGRLLPELAGPVLVGEEKVRALLAHTRAPVLAAFGDDVRDLPLLALGTLRVAVRPTEVLLSRAAEIGGLTLLAGV